MKLLSEHLDEKTREWQRRSGSFLRDGEVYRTQLFESTVRRRDELLVELLRSLTASGSDHPVVLRLRDEIEAYVHRCDWCLLDTLHLAACQREDPAILSQRLAASLLVYHGFRLLDDLFDDHSSYKGRFPTLLAKIEEFVTRRDRRLTFLTLPAVLLLLDGACVVSTEVRELAKQTINGMIIEKDCGKVLPEAKYRTLVNQKSVSYGLILYIPVLEKVSLAVRGAVEDFVRESIVVSQILNDLVDVKEDNRLEQPNFWLAATCLETAAAQTLAEFTKLETRVLGLDPIFRPYAWNRLDSVGRYIIEIIEDGVALPSPAEL